jgi:hypothetical protein
MSQPNYNAAFPSSGVEAAQMATKTIQNSWDLFKMSWGLLWKQAFFLVITLLVSIGASLIFARFVYQLGIVQFLIQHTHRVGNTNNFHTDGLGAQQGHDILLVIAAFFGFLMLMHIFNFFMKAVLAAAANAQLTRTQNPLIAGLTAPLRYFFAILGWLVVSGTVGFVTGIRSGNGNPVEDVAANVSQGFFESAWKIITFLTVPVMVVEHAGPINGIKRSAQLVRDTWGRQLVGKYGIDSITGGITGALFLVIVLIGGGLTYFTRSTPVGLVSALTLIGVLACIGAVRNALVTIYQTVLYHYANKDHLPGYAPNAFQNVFATK